MLLGVRYILSISLLFLIYFYSIYSIYLLMLYFFVLFLIRLNRMFCSDSMCSPSPDLHAGCPGLHTGLSSLACRGYRGPTRPRHVVELTNGVLQVYTVCLTQKRRRRWPFLMGSRSVGWEAGRGRSSKDLAKWEGNASRLEAIASRVEAIASRWK